MRVSSYGEVYVVGHSALGTELLDGPVVVEEKVDGSQFGFGRYDGELCCRSKNVQLIIGEPANMFEAAIRTADSLDLHDGWTYRAEYLRVPRHNTLAYNVIPPLHLILFDVEIGPQRYLDTAAKAAEAERLGLWCVPCLHEGPLESTEGLRRFFEHDSVLGGCKIEGVVIKNYAKYGPNKKILTAKMVREEFVEANQIAWKQQNPSQTDAIDAIIESFRTDARWHKAIQHMRDNGTLVGGPEDIGPLISEVHRDVAQECADDIKAALWKWAWPRIRRGIVRGLPEWYKVNLDQTERTEQ